MYSCDTWPLKADHERRLDAFEHKNWRWILHISYTEHVRNSTVRDRIGIAETASAAIKRRRLVWLGHVLRMNDSRLAKQSLLFPVPKEWKRPCRGVRKTWRRRVFGDLDCDAVHNIIRRNATYFKNHWLDEIQRIAQDRNVYGDLVNNV